MAATLAVASDPGLWKAQKIMKRRTREDARIDPDHPRVVLR